MQPGQSASSQDTADWNQLLVDTAATAGKATSRSPARGEVMVSLAGALRQGFKTLERLDLRGCFVGVSALRVAGGRAGGKGWDWGWGWRRGTGGFGVEAAVVVYTVP